MKVADLDFEGTPLPVTWTELPEGPPDNYEAGSYELSIEAGGQRYSCVYREGPRDAHKNELDEDVPALTAEEAAQVDLLEFCELAPRALRAQIDQARVA